MPPRAIPAQPAACGKAKLAMAQRLLDGAANFRHEGDERQGPARRQHIDRGNQDAGGAKLRTGFAP